MLQVALSCRDNMTNSGIFARVAGDAIDAKLFLPNMATEEFLACLSKAAIENAAAAEGVKIGSRGKDTRANLIERYKTASTSTRAPCSRRHRTRSPRPDATRATGSRAAARTMPALRMGRAPEAATTSVPRRTALTRVRGPNPTKANYRPPRSEAPGPARWCRPGLLAFRRPGHNLRDTGRGPPGASPALAATRFQLLLDRGRLRDAIAVRRQRLAEREAELVAACEKAAALGAGRHIRIDDPATWDGAGGIATSTPRRSSNPTSCRRCSASSEKSSDWSVWSRSPWHRRHPQDERRTAEREK